jgi:tetratricopeptide (TPR) repeat protein
MRLTSTGPDRHQRRSRHDAYGLEITVDSPRALDLYNQGVESLLGFGDAARRFFEEAVQVEEDFALAHGMIGVCHFLEERAAEARAALEVAQRDASRLTPRERRHLQALALWVGGRSVEAAGLIRDVLKEFPRDIALVQRLFFIEFWRGGFPGILELTSSVVDHYPHDTYMLGMHAFALEEMRHFRPALALAEAALTLNRKNAWAVHAMAHILYEQGDNAAGIAFLPPAVERCDHLGYFRTHLIWHLTLFHLAAGEYSRVMDRYHEGIRAGGFQMPQELHDAISLLWRQWLSGREMAVLWRELADFARGRITKPNLLFHDLHLGMALAAAADFEAVERQRTILRERAVKARSPVTQEVGLPLFEGLMAFAQGDYAATIAHMAPIQGRIIEVGGSNAQREVFHDTLLEAYLRAGEMDGAARLLRQRLAHRPQAGRWWYRLGQTQAARNQLAEARASLKRVLDLWKQADPDAPERVSAASLLASLSS